MRAGAGGTQAPTSLGPVLVADVEHAHAGVLIGREDQLGADEAAGPVLVDVVRAEMAALALVVGLGRRAETSRC